MAIAVWTETNMACPHCQKAIRRGKRRFGPGKVICYNCKKEIETGLIDIYGISKPKRILYILLDWFFPSYFRGFDQPSKLLIMFFHLLLALSPPILIGIVIFIFIGGKNLSNAFAVLPFVLYTLLHLLWLLRMLKQTKDFHNTGKKPVWRAPIVAR